MSSTLQHVGAVTPVSAPARAEAILAAVVYGAQSFMKNADWTDVPVPWLQRLGEAAGADQVRVFENDEREPGGVLTSSLRAQWIAPGAPAGSPPEALQRSPFRDAGCARWEELLSRGDAVVGNRRDFPACEHPVMEREGITSVAIVPVFVAQRWWGFLGFAECATERTWLGAELNALFAAAGIYGAALARREMEQRIAAAAAQEQLAGEIGEVLTATARGLDDLLQLCSERIAHHLQADVVCVWTVDRDPAVLRPASPALPPELQLEPAPARVGDCAVGRIARSAAAESWQDRLPELWPGSEAATAAAGLRTGVGQPLVADGQVVGVVVMLHREPLGQRALQGLFSVTDELALAIERSRATSALHLTEDRYRRLVDATLEGICIHDGRSLHDANPSLAAMVGYEVSEIIGRNPLEFMHPDDRAAVMQRIASNYTGAYEARMVSRDGRVVPVEIQGRSFYHDGMKLRVAAIRDLSERKEAERTAQHLVRERQARELAERSRVHAEFLLDASRILASSFDTTTTLNQLAHLCVRLLGDFCVVTLYRGGVAEQIAHVHADPARHDVLARAVALWGAHWHESHPLSLRQKQGDAYIVEVSDSERAAMARDAGLRDVLEELGTRWLMSAPIMSGGELIGSIMVSAGAGRGAFDAQELATAQELARRAAVALESAQSYYDARAATQARDELLAVVAHDLRNPLNVIQLGSGLALDMTADQPDSAGRRQLEIIQRSAEQMNRLIQDLLDATRLQAGQLALELLPTRPHVIVRDALALLLPLAHNAGITLDGAAPEDLPPFPLDRTRMQQVLSNLVGNALKFTPRGGRVTVAARAVDGGVAFSVSDTGPGIPAEQLQHVFGRFWQARRTDKRGLGLGLAIAKGIVEAHGGEISVDSREGVGTTFVFTLPFPT